MFGKLSNMFRPKSGWERVLEALQADDESTRADAVSEVPRIPEPAPGAIRQAVVQLLFDIDPAVRRSAKRALNNGLAEQAVVELGGALSVSGEYAADVLEIIYGIVV